jgi:hypothetical protein
MRSLFGVYMSFSYIIDYWNLDKIFDITYNAAIKNEKSSKMHSVNYK